METLLATSEINSPKSLDDVAVDQRWFDEEFQNIIDREYRQPPVIAVAEMENDILIRERAAAFIGSVLMNNLSEPNHEIENNPEYTLKDAIHAAAAGDAEARRLIETNVRSDMIERSIKKGHVMKVELERGPNGRIIQFGQTAEQIQANSLLYGSKTPQMVKRIKTETLNQFRIASLLEKGVLEEYALLVPSLVPDDMSEEQAAKEGFFSDTMSMALQLTTAENTKITVETAFIAGKKNWHSPRHDKNALAELGRKLGVELTGLDSPVLIHKSQIPNGVIDVARELDDAAGGTFFGEDKPRQDYELYLQKCRQREAELEPRVRAVTDQLIAESDNFDTPGQATHRLGKLSAKQMIDLAIKDRTIDAKVFGTAAAYRIEHARHYYDLGQIDQAGRLANAAFKFDASSSCPGGGAEDFKNEPDMKFQEGKSTNSKLDDCEFISKECPKCHKKNVKTVAKNGKYYGSCGCHT